MLGKSPYIDVKANLPNNKKLVIVYGKNHQLKTQIQSKQAPLKDMPFIGKSEISDKATTNEAWNFEIYNKYDRPIGIMLLNKGGESAFLKAPVINSFQKFRGVIDFSKIGTIEIKVNEKNLNYRINVRSNHAIKSMFLTFDENGLRPQTGILGGMLDIFDKGQTDSGINFTKETNITQDEIR